MLTLMMMNDNDIASKFKTTVRILFVFSQILVLIIRIWLNSKDFAFDTALLLYVCMYVFSATDNFQSLFLWVFLVKVQVMFKVIAL